ncbi:MAG TPA: thiamine pyrophosphate-dependent enzyme, partial [Blastocatellia bacterium]|nr:thiamine pyrophosphate-dependent enzyme [Blastocatellia bacterium]
VVIFKNNSLGQIKWEQIAMEGNPEFGVALQPIDFAAYARACGAAGFTIQHQLEAENILKQALANDGPALVEAIVDPNEPPMPGKITMEQALRFTESMVRGDKNRGAILKNLAKNVVREVI